MAYTTIKKPSDYFNTVTYTGDGNATQAITNTFQTDFSWIKHRGTTAAHTLQDAVRGFSESKKLSSNSADAENNASGATWGDYGGVSAVGATSFTVYKGSQTPYQTNESGANYVAWNWKAGTGQGSSNTDGSINTTYTSVNTTAGFSISSFTGTGANATFGHGLGAVPKMYILKRYDSSNNWRVYHESVGNGKYMTLETNEAEQTSSGFTNNTSPTSSLISLGNLGSANPSGGSVICYAFAEKTGYSKFGSYTGNGNADGTFVYTGFKPAFVMVKRTDTTKNWYLQDSSRNGYNASNPYLSPNINVAETGGTEVDILSNGFKLRASGTGHNQSGGTYIYMAFAEQPLVGDNPATAR